jgi:CheY-like chemotaxis protein
MGNKILLADDSITIQKVVNLTFADEGIEVVAVSNGDMAERRLSDVNPDLVLADIFMPGKNGYELCEAIKKSPQFHNVPVVLLVGAFEPFDQAEARRVRADAHLTKPFESRTLVETVRKLISTTEQSRTASLAQSQPAAAQDERRAEAQGSAAPPSTKPDIPAMPVQLATAPPARAEESNSSHAPVASDRTSIAQDQGKADYAEALPSLEVQLDPEPYQEQPDFSSASNWMEQPDTTTFASSAEEHLSDPFDLSPLEVSAQDMEGMEGAASIDGLEAGDAPDFTQDFDNVALDLEPIDSVLSPGFGDDDQEMILDLDRPEPAYTHETNTAASFDIASDRAFGFNTGGLRSETAQASSRTASEVFKTQMLETPHGFAEAEERINTNPLEMPPATDYSRSSLSPSGFAELEEDTLSSTLLAVDDPLGDVLMDEREMDVLPYDAHAAPQVLFTEQPENVEFNLEFIPQEEKVFGFAESTATASRVTGELIEPAHSSLEAPLAATDTIEQAAESYAQSETATGEAHPAASNEFVDASPMFESFITSTEQTESEARTERAESGFEFSSDFQVVAPEREFELGQYTFDSIKERPSEEAEPARAAEFTASEMWNEQAGRFAPIDIEATPVDESEPASATTERSGLETGFELASEIVEGPSQAADAPVAERATAVERQPVVKGPTVEESQLVAESQPIAERMPDEEPRTAEAAAERAELSPAILDEIVRRVIAQMSEAVVREIAWEVVPDVVERVIKEMTREETSKRI